MNTSIVAFFIVILATHTVAFTTTYNKLLDRTLVVLLGNANKPYSLTDLLIPTYQQNLKTLSTWLDKDGVDEGLLSHRLAPDMFPFSTQVRFICLQSQEAVYRLQGKDIPKHVVELGDEGRSFAHQTDDDDDAAKDTVEACKARIQQVLDFLDEVEEDALDRDGSAERTLTLDLAPGMTFDMTGGQYARDWALPQLYFHLVAAYSILRNAGVELGKADYVPHMFAYLRTAPPPPPAGIE